MVKPPEILDIFVHAGIGIDLDIRYNNAAEGSGGTFVVKGPPEKLGILQFVATGKHESRHTEIAGVVSPQTPVTLPAAVKIEAGIPVNATQFCFVAPLVYFRRHLHRFNLASNPWGFLHLLGGFAYFDDDNNVLGVNALTIIPSPTVLHMIGPYMPNQSAVAAIRDLGRMSDVVVDSLLDAGFTRFGYALPLMQQSLHGHEYASRGTPRLPRPAAFVLPIPLTRAGGCLVAYLCSWVHPSEQPKAIALGVENLHGGFIYETDEGASFFVSMEPVTAPANAIPPSHCWQGLSRDGTLRLLHSICRAAPI